MRKVVIAGGTGFLGSCLAKHFSDKNDRVIILTRGASRTIGSIEYKQWDGKTLGTWAECLESADVLINLNGKSVDCRYSEKNKKLIYATRLEATQVLGHAIQQCKQPPKLWINSASATIYRHSLDKEMDEFTGEIGSGFSVDVCQQWERVFKTFNLSSTRKVIIRTGIVLGKRGGPLKPLKMLAKLGAGGKHGNGNQYFSWLHENDFVNIVEFICSNAQLNGVYNVTAPSPIPNQQFMRALRTAVGSPLGLPLPKWLLEIGAILIGTETELILKSRRVVPKRLLDAGYRFNFMTVEGALKDLVTVK
jgi:uncharacterized protein (TIGR01777 family)